MINTVAECGVQEINGVPTGTFTDLTSARYCTNDDSAPGLVNPIPIPVAGFNYSFWKSHVLVMSGTFTQIGNIRWYTDGTIQWSGGTSGVLHVGKTFSGDYGANISSNYTQASGTVGITGWFMISGHSLYQLSGMTTVLATSSVVGNPYVIDSNSYMNEGARSKAVVTQMAVDTNAIQGTKPAETITFRYDEI